MNDIKILNNKNFYYKHTIKKCEYTIIQNKKEIENLKQKIFELEKTNNLLFLESLELSSELEKLKENKNKK